MQSFEKIEDYEQLKILADPRRLALLRHLMGSPATISQLGRAFGRHPAWIRHHVKRLEGAGLVELIDPDRAEKYYRATARAYMLQMTLLPEEGSGAILALGSHDLALEALAGRLRALPTPVELLAAPIGSLDGLILLRQGNGHLAGAHLLDTETGEFNVPYARHLFGGQPVVLVTLAERTGGLIVAPGNPLGLRGIADLAGGVTLINRNRGSGTRVWLDWRLQALGIPPAAVRGYPNQASTHLAVAAAVAAGRAGAGLGILAAARRFGLDFIPLYQERYDLVFRADQLDAPRLRPLLDELTTAAFRREVEALGGYDTHHSGDRIPVGA